MTPAPTAPQRTTTIVVTDDHAIVREGLRLLLDAEADMRVVGEAADVAGTLRTVVAHAPRVLVLDLQLAERNALDALPAIAEASPGTAVVVLTMHRDPAVARRALRCGASGFVLKDSAATELVRAIRCVARGMTYLQPEIGGLIAGLDQEGPNLLDQISEREVEVLRLVALGHTSREVADQLILSIRTVESHRAHLQRKLGCDTRAELVRYALTHGLLATT